MLTGCGDQTSEEKIGTFTANFTCNDRHVWVIKTSVYVYIYIYFISHFHRICSFRRTFSAFWRPLHIIRLYFS